MAELGQYAIAGAIVIACAAYLWRRYARTARGVDSVCGCGKRGVCALADRGATACATAPETPPTTRSSASATPSAPARAGE